ncbi:substrate-binding domain-containing protein, partial [Nocardiopsis sediminis]
RVRAADGCLFFGRHVPDDAIRRLSEDGFPFVYIGRREEPGISYIGADYVAASAEVAVRIAAQGHHRIRYLRENDDAPASTDRERGVVDGARGAGLDTAGLVERTDGADVDARLARWLGEGVTAVITEETDTGAALSGLTAAIARAGLSCPGDLSLALLGRPATPAGAVPALAGEISGFSVPMREMGRAAVRLLLDLIEGTAPAPPRHALLACAPVPGATIGPPPPAR